MIEMLVVATVLGLLTAIAALQVQRFRERASLSVMKSDLRNLAVAQESHFYDQMVYAGDPADLRGWQSSGGVTVEIMEATNTGWSAQAEGFDAITRCYVFVRTAAPIGLATREGIVECG
jgi:type II secretory pathway pseudopilin PulG